MTPEEKNMLERALKLAEDNNDLLIKMNRRARNGQILQVLYWLLIVGLSFGAYYFIQPYINWAESMFTSGSTTSATPTLNIQSIQDMLKSFSLK